MLSVYLLMDDSLKFTRKRVVKWNIILAWMWFAFGLLGLADYIWGTHYLANSIPVLFFISVYANFVGHLSASEAANESYPSEPK